ncbi:MAG: family 10 glycosylhydrolase [Bacteroides sp.]|nr:family 10 glycosylhydrolase [Bacteroides sp.]
MRQLALFILFIIVATTATAQPKHEVRAAWITTLYGLDWPDTKALSLESIRRQQGELVEILDKLKAANINTILFQTRGRGDVFYSSKMEPYSAMLTGKSGRSPGYDPLSFVIEECHKRGMECHAWIVTIPLGGKKQVKALGAQSVVKRHPKLCVSYKQDYYLNPAHPETKNYLMSLVREIVEGYDVDGVHFDYLRYPEKAARFPDGCPYRKYAESEKAATWRRNNITAIMRHLYQGVKALKPWVKVSTAPVGKLRDTTLRSSYGWNAVHAVRQDVAVWLSEGIQDQIYPMLYFREDDFYPFALDWLEVSNGRHVIPGLGIYFLDPKEGDWKTEEVERQVHFLRRSQASGEGYYRARFLTDNTQGIHDLLQEKLYPTPALVPSMPWLDNIPPTPPANLQAVREADDCWQLNWQAATDNDPHNAPMYNVYGSGHLPVDTDNPGNILATNLRDTTFLYVPLFPWKACRHFVVKAVDRYGNESR